MSKVTIYDVAREVPCSPATVSLVLKKSKKIKPLTHQRVLEVVNRLGYSPNFAARSLSLKYTKLLGLIVPSLENPLFAQMVRGVEECANINGYNMILGISDQSMKKEMFYMDMLSERRVDGLLVFPTFVDEVVSHFLSQKSDSYVPVVLCGSSGAKFSIKDISYVKCDNRIGAFMAVDHLISTGRKKIALICAVADNKQGQSRIDGYRDALNHHKIEYSDSRIKFCSQDENAIFDAASSLLKDGDIDSIFCLYDYMSLTVMRAIQNLGLKIPKDIAVMGYDNIKFSEFLPISLSTIDTHSQRVGYLAAELLIKKILNPKEPCQRIVLEPSLIVRESTQIIK